ncbi:ABC transporter substrate-binding protein [candidate division KSB3 bacterium]|uniref:ABC transporter substrate-binding protein n=1 Tax=candidate division KSB3 bacterium TaxID=2044937 RepID=A0A2G6E9Y8_9BACT|nr:MAG: ABC transporter substrate-binding protein [candidate division KSB3 bacterium]PIE30838.1 MAG: ABC transporter substrate-binding protein [candidate division KSB3 bacterium]
MKIFVTIIAALCISIIFIPVVCRDTAAGELSGELTIVNWLGGSEYDLVIELEEHFKELYPGVSVKDINLTGSADARPLLKSMLLGGQIPDLLISAWPSFDKELQQAGILAPLNDAWEKYNWDKALNASWKELGSIDGKVYGIYFLADNRSGLWYRSQDFTALKTPLPTSWDTFKTLAHAYKDAGKIPITVGADSWAHTEYFENLLLRVGGPEIFMKLARHEIPWTDPVVVKSLTYWKELLDEGLFADGATMLGTAWDVAFKQVMQNSAGMNLIGSWVHGMAQQEFAFTPVKDYDFFQFPTIDPSVPANYMQISAKNWLVCSGGKNTQAALAFLNFVLSEEAGSIIAKYGGVSPNSLVSADVYDPIGKKTATMFAENGVVFVLDDLLPTEVSSEYRVQLQRFLNDPSEEQIQKTLEAIEAKAKAVY